MYIAVFGVKGIYIHPIHVYTNSRIYSIGKIECPLKKGVFKIGGDDFKSQGYTKFSNHGKIIIEDFTEINGCTILENLGTIIFHGYNRVADGCTILIREKFELGKYSRIGFHSFVMDGDDHFTVDVSTKSVCRITKPIIIGNYNWIASNTYIKKGTITPDYLIVASANALLTKDYSQLPPYTIIGGIPARVLKTGQRRIFDKNSEKILREFFNSNKTVDLFTYGQELDLDQICLTEEGKFEF